ncbi:PhzF family phenazine biosynthesis protein [Gilvimarinus polysaccharolyticus]|uniref:PhzF family phenazine biosynthesis protein n=1 Tax=Gilvimarinus polysaccharolyticus TaxID=863921 RepID=UPI00067337D1|nr:PhzF family phenazine biosynthesis protein [Gilvimarinus polysaccharolyticus]
MIVDSFCGPRALGNRHYIVVLEKFTLAQNADHIPQQVIQPQANTVVLWQQRGSWHVRFFDKGQPVRRCGSGNIAIAAYMHNRYQRPFTQTLQTIAGTVVLGVDTTGAYYRDRPGQIIPIKNLAHWEHLCQTPLTSAAQIGGRQDYTLVLLPNSEALLRLKLRSHALKLYSARSVIALAPAPRHWQLRYFAPQYGVPEDAATGSACVQASGYLAKKTNKHHFNFIQRSPAGGIIHTEHRSQHTIVRGNYQLISD